MIRRRREKIEGNEFLGARERERKREKNDYDGGAQDWGVDAAVDWYQEKTRADSKSELATIRHDRI